MPNTSVDLEIVDPSLEAVFGPLPTRFERGQWASVGARKTAYRQLSRDYAPVRSLELTENESSVFNLHGLADVVKFQSNNPDFAGDYFWCPREPFYRVHKTNNPLGINMIVVNMQADMLENGTFFRFEEVYPHPVLLSMWREKFAIEL